MVRKRTGLIPLVLLTALALVGCQPPAAPFSFEDSFDRPDDVLVGNGWISYAPTDGSYVKLANHTVVLYGAGINAAGIYRTFDRFTGNFDLSVKVVVNASSVQIWMVNDAGKLYMVDFSLTAIDIRKENTVLQSASITATAFHLYELRFRKTGTTLVFQAVDVTSAAVPVVIQATESTYDSFTGLQIWGGNGGNASWISSVSLVNQ